MTVGIAGLSLKFFFGLSHAIFYYFFGITCRRHLNVKCQMLIYTAHSGVANLKSLHSRCSSFIGHRSSTLSARARNYWRLELSWNTNASTATAN